jgi:glycosyltransferase involved in cell wall biosynthesis
MKIAEIVCVFPPYKAGIGKVAEMQSNGLSQLGEIVEVFTPDFGHEKITDRKYKINYLKPIIKFGNAAFLPQLFWKLKKFDAIILHYPFFGSAEILWFMKKLRVLPGKLFVYYHMDFAPTNLFFKIFSLPSKIILKSLLKSAEKIMVQSIDYTENSALRNFYLNNKEKFVEIPLGAEVRNLSAIATGDPEYSGETVVAKADKLILFVGAMDKAHYFKGVDVLLKAFKKLMNYKLEIMNYELWLVGDGDLRPQYEKLAQELGLEKKVKFLGRVSDEEKEKLYGECEFLVLPSINSGEAFGIVLVEAMARGKAIIATDLPGVRTVCKNGINGFLAKPGDINDLAEKMKILLSDENLRNKFGMEGIKMVEEKYNWATHTNVILRTIHQQV